MRLVGVALLVVALSIFGYLLLSLISVLRNYDDIDWGDDDF